MRISVVIIAFNLEAYIRDAIDSVIRQTRRADEIIVVDDCSEDDTPARIRSYGDSIIYQRTERNSGAFLAALHGIKAASGDVVCMLDGDDIWQDNKLTVVERVFAADPELVLLSHDHVRVDANGVDLAVRDHTHRNIASITRKACSASHLSSLLKETILDQKGYWLGSAYSFRRSAFDISKFERQIAVFPFDKLRTTYLDLVIAPYLVLTNASGDVGYTADTKFFYRIHDKASISDNFTPGKAIASAVKARTTNELIDIILRENDAPTTYLARRNLILSEYDYLMALYAKHYISAISLFLVLSRKYWDLFQLKKETKRLLAVVTLGPSKFLKMKNA